MSVTTVFIGDSKALRPPRALMHRASVQAITAAVLALGAQYAQAQACNISPVTTVCTTARVIGSSGTFEVNSGGALDVVGGVAITSNEGSTLTINNSGRISGATGFRAEDPGGVITINNNNSGVLAGTTAATSRSHTANIDIYNNNSTANVVGGITARTVSNSGTITLKTGVDLSDIRNSGSGAATATISNTFTQTSTGTLRVAIVSTSAEGSFSSLQASGVTLAGKLDVDVKSGSGLSLSSGLQTFRVVRATGGSISGQFGELTDNSALFNFTQRKANGDEDLYIDVVRASTVEQATQANGNVPGTGAAKVLDTQPTGMQSVLDKLAQLPTTAEVSKAVSQTLPLLTGDSVVATSGAMSGINRVVQARIESNTGLSSGDGFAGDKNVWMKPFGSAASQDDSGSVAGYKARVYGLAGGVDGTLSSTTRMGLAVAYANAAVDSNASSAPQSTKVDVYQVIAYGSTSLDDSTELSYQVDFGNSNNKGRRELSSFSVVAESNYKSQSMHAGLGIGRTYAVNESTSFTPTARVDYTQVKDDGYTETGAGSLNLLVSERTSDQLVYALDGKFSHKLNPATTLSFNLGVAHDTKAKQSSITAAYAGASSLAFTTQGMDVSPTTYRLGLGFVNKGAKGLEINGRYDMEGRAGFTNQTLSAKLRWTF